MELWGGFECTVNRVGDVYRDQLKLTGLHDRPGDLALAAKLGITALRFPVLWERVSPKEGGEPDWAWSDAGMAELARLGIRPIVGLLHHGSGPAHTDLLAANFVPGLAAHAAAVAERYPHVLDWTPVNEPVTTARFSALYGAWYPHARDRWCFFLAVLQQVEATAAAMAAIRRVQPAARLIQTDDLGMTYAEPGVEDVADFYNSRRWLAWDLLTGRVSQGHFWWQEAEELGFGDRVRALADAPCQPAIVGINHYPTSDRLLRPRPGGVGAERFADREALRAMPEQPGGLALALSQAWERYGIPLAITESHLGCTLEEQLRWLKRGWETAVGLNAIGVDVRAVTVWALMGNVDWTSLLTESRGDYEAGAFDIRGDAPRPTAVARLAATLKRPPSEPVLHAIAAQPGWWEREIRLTPEAREWPDAPLDQATRPLLITGATTSLGQAFARACRMRGLTYVLTDRGDNAEALAKRLDQYHPWAVIDAAGCVGAEGAPGHSAAGSDEAPLIAAACAQREIAIALFSSDLLSEMAAAMRGLALDPRPLVMRTAAVPDLVGATLNLLLDGESGLWPEA